MSLKNPDTLGHHQNILISTSRDSEFSELLGGLLGDSDEQPDLRIVSF